MRITAENLDIKARLTKMEIVTNNVTQYSRCKCLALHEVPTSINDQDLGEKVVQVLSLTGVSINQDDIVQWHRLKKENSCHCKRIGFKDAVFINESMSPGYKYLPYLCRRLLRDRQIHYY